jgi:hypothetical protein
VVAVRYTDQERETDELASVGGRSTAGGCIKCTLNCSRRLQAFFCAAAAVYMLTYEVAWSFYEMDDVRLQCRIVRCRRRNIACKRVGAVGRRQCWQSCSRTHCAVPFYPLILAYCLHVGEIMFSTFAISVFRGYTQPRSVIYEIVSIFAVAAQLLVAGGRGA